MVAHCSSTPRKLVQSNTAQADASRDHPVRETLHHFEDGDETVTVRLTEHRGGIYTAIDLNDADLAVGQGFSSIGAIADLFEKLPRAASEREERNRQADAWDRERDYRKHEVVS